MTEHLDVPCEHGAMVCETCAYVRGVEAGRASAAGVGSTVYAVVLDPGQDEHNDPEVAFSTRAAAEAFCKQVYDEDERAKRRLKNRRHYDVVEIPFHHASPDAHDGTCCTNLAGVPNCYDPAPFVADDGIQHDMETRCPKCGKDYRLHKGDEVECVCPAPADEAVEAARRAQSLANKAQSRADKMVAEVRAILDRLPCHITWGDSHTEDQRSLCRTCSAKDALESVLRMNRGV